MTFHFQQALRALILVTFTALIIKLHMTGEITKLINPKYIGLSKAAAILFLLLFLIQITRVWTNKQHHHHPHCNHDHEDEHCDHHHTHCDHGHEGEDCGHHHDHGDSPFNLKKFLSYSIIVFPLLTGFLLPPKVLDASIVDKKGGIAILANQKQKANEGENPSVLEDSTSGENTNLPEGSTLDGGEAEIEEDSFIDDYAIPDLEYKNLMTKKEYDQLITNLEQSQKIVMEDSVFAAFYDEISYDLEKYRGKEIELTGMVYKEEGLEENQLVLSRFLITHCVADASIIGFLTEIPEASEIDQDTWIQASGVIEITTFNGIEMPTIRITNWKKVQEPAEPYLYPITIKIA